MRCKGTHFFGTGQKKRPRNVQIGVRNGRNGVRNGRKMKRELQIILTEPRYSVAEASEGYIHGSVALRMPFLALGMTLPKP